jgi:hypothetical protein
MKTVTSIGWGAKYSVAEARRPISSVVVPLPVRRNDFSKCPDDANTP